MDPGAGEVRTKALLWALWFWNISTAEPELSSLIEYSPAGISVLLSRKLIRTVALILS